MTPLVTSLGANAGKTAVALALATTARERGQRVGYLKPRGTRSQGAAGESRDEDVALACEMLDFDADGRGMEPVVYSATLVQESLRGREDPEVLRERVRERFAELATDRDRMVLEGGGSPRTGGVVGLTDADVADLLDATVVLVAPYEEPGDVDDVLAAADLLSNRLGGVLFNAVPDAAFDGVASDAVPYLESRGIRVYGTVPRDADLAAVSVAELAGELGAEVLTDGAPVDGRVRRLAVGATSAGDAADRLEALDDAALVVGGGRADVQTVALEAAGVTCLLATGGSGPSEAVLDRAESAGVPVLRVDAGPETALAAAEAVVEAGGPCDAEAVERMRQLLADYADVDAMLTAPASERED
jgi:BioD-like phosphotransacetylase family protein